MFLNLPTFFFLGYRNSKIIYLAMTFFILCTTNGMETPPQEIVKFFQQLPTMPIQLAHSTYHRYSPEQKNAIQNQIALNQMRSELDPKQDAEIILTIDALRIPQLNTKLLGQIDSLIIKTPKNPLKSKLTAMFTAKSEHDIDSYLQMTLAELDVAHNEHMQINNEMNQLFANFESLHYCLSLSNIQFINKYFEYCTSTVNQPKFPVTCYQYRYKIKQHNVQGLKALLMAFAYNDHKFFYLPEYAALITTLCSFGLSKYIELNFCSLIKIGDYTTINEEIKKFNRLAQLLNEQAKKLTHLFNLKTSEQPLLSEMGFSNLDILKISLPLLLHVAIALLHIGLNFNKNLPTLNQKSYYYEYFSQKYQASSVLMPMLLFCICVAFPSISNYLNSPILFIYSIISVTLLYGTYFYTTVSKHMNETHFCRFSLEPEEIKKILQRTDIEILN